MNGPEFDIKPTPKELKRDPKIDKYYIDSKWAKLQKKSEPTKKSKLDEDLKRGPK